MNIKFGSFIVKEKCQTGAASMFVGTGACLGPGRGRTSGCFKPLGTRAGSFSARKGSWRNGQATRSCSGDFCGLGAPSWAYGNLLRP